MRKALFNKTTGLVVNIIELEEGANWQPPDEHDVVDAAQAGPGDTWDGSQFLKAVPVVEKSIFANWTSLFTSQKLDLLKKVVGG